MLNGKAINQAGSDQITSHGNQLVYECSADNAAEDLCQCAVQAKNIDIARRVVAPVGLVEHSRADIGQRVAPGGEAVHIHLIAFNIEGYKDPEQRSKSQSHDGEERIPREFPDGRCFVHSNFTTVKLQMLSEVQRNNCVNSTHCDEPRPKWRSFCGVIGGRLINHGDAWKCIPGIGVHILRQGFNFHER